MQEGSRIHRKIQKAMPSGYAAEVSLKMELPLEDGEKVLPADSLELTREGQLLLVEIVHEEEMTQVALYLREGGGAV